MVETEGSRQSSRPNKGQPAKRLAEDNSSSESEYEPTYKQQPKKKKGPKTNNKKTNSPPTTKEDSVPTIINPPSANASNDINTQPSHDAHDNKSINDDDDNNNDDDDDDNETSTAATLYNVTGEVLFNTIATSAVGNDAFATAATIANLSPDRSALTPTLTATIAKETATTKRASTAKHTSKKKDVAVSASKKSRKHQRRTKWDNDIKNDAAVRKGWVKLSSDGMTIDCRLCDSIFNARQPFSGASYLGVKGHKESTKHTKKLAEKQFAEKRDAKRIAEGKPLQNPVKSFTQSTISFGRRSTKTDSAQTQVSATSTASANANQSTDDTSTTMPAILKGCTGVIPLKLCKDVGSKLNLSIVHRFGRLDPNSAYELKEVQEGSYFFNLYHKSCTNESVHVGGTKQAGNRCVDCSGLWTEKSSKISKAMKGRIDNLKRAESLLLKPTLTEEDANSMTDFTRTGDQSLNDHAGKRLKDMVRERLVLYKSLIAIPACNETITSPESSGSITVTKGQDSFLYDFIEMYTTNKEMQDSLLSALMQVMVSKLNGRQNPELPVKAMNFFIAIDSMSRKTFDFVSANFLGPSLRTIQRQNAKHKEPSIICLEESDLVACLNKHLGSLPEFGKTTYAISVGFDGTKVPSTLTLSTTTRSILGGVYPKHAIDISEMTKDEVQDLLDPKSDIERAKEMKTAVITIQNPGIGHSPYFTLAAQPQSVNMVSGFNERVTSLVSRLCKAEGNASLVSVAADGVGCDAKFIQGQLVSFLRGEVNHVALVDTNHNAKNFRYQMIGGSCVVIMGNHVMDPALLSLANVPGELWRVKDWASDLIVLRLASAKSVAMVVTLSNEEVGSVSLMCVTLYFIRLKLFAVNTKKAHFRDRIAFLWASTIWLTSFESKSLQGTNQSNMSTNRRNLFTETIALVLAMARDDVTKPRMLTTESNEHTFGGWRSVKREATVQECTEIETKRRNKIRAVFSSDLKVSRDTKKGYSATFDSFVEVGRVASGESSGPVAVVNSNDTSAVDLLWEVVKPIINATNAKMVGLLDRFGVSEAARSPLCCQFDNVSELSEIYLSKLPRDVRVGTGGADDVVTGGEEDMEGGDAPDSATSRRSSKVNMSTLQDLLSEVDSGNSDPSSRKSADVIIVDDADGTKDGDGDTAGDTSIDDAVFAEDGEFGSTAASRKFRSLLMAKTMDDIVVASNEGMQCLQIKKNETGSTTGNQKFKSLSGRWYVKEEAKPCSNNADVGVSSGSGGEKSIERNSRVQVTITEGRGSSTITSKEDFRVLVIYTKYDGKWYPADDKGSKQPWKKGIGSGKYRLLARMINIDRITGAWEDTKPDEVTWGTKSIFILVDANDVSDVLEKIVLEQ